MYFNSWTAAWSAMCRRGPRLRDVKPLAGPSVSLSAVPAHTNNEWTVKCLLKTHDSADNQGTMTYATVREEEQNGMGPDSAGQSGDTQGLSDVVEAGGESVQELLEEGQASRLRPSAACPATSVHACLSRKSHITGMGGAPGILPNAPSILWLT